jgi:hypothetical protein
VQGVGPVHANGIRHVLPVGHEERHFAAAKVQQLAFSVLAQMLVIEPRNDIGDQSRPGTDLALIPRRNQLAIPVDELARLPLFAVSHWFIYRHNPAQA